MKLVIGLAVSIVALVPVVAREIYQHYRQVQMRIGIARLRLRKEQMEFNQSRAETQRRKAS